MMSIVSLVKSIIRLKRTVSCDSPADILLIPVSINPILFKLLIRNLLDNTTRYYPDSHWDPAKYQYH